MFEKDIHYSIHLESAILGIAMLESGSFGKIYGMVEEDCFYVSGHKIVFSALKEMYSNGVPIDVATVIDYISRVKGVSVIDSYNTAYFVIRITNDVVSSAHMEYHAYIVKTMWMEREIIKLTHSGVNGMSGDVRDKIYNLQKKLQSLQEKTAQHDWVDMTQLMVDLYRHQDSITKTGGIGLKTGVKTLDKENGGFHPGQLVVIGARPSVGKSALVGGMAVDIAKNNKTVGIVSLEMSNTEIAARLASYDTNTDFNVIFRALYFDTRQRDELYNKIGQSTSTLPIYVTDKTDVNVVEIRAKAEKLKSLHGLDCLMIDYLQLVEAPEGFNRNRENEIAQMSRSCKIMAKEMNIPVILLCQLNREVTKRKGAERYPQLSDLRESGSIEQDADVVMFLHRDWMAGFEQDENGNSTERQADLVVRKWRNGKNNFIIPLDFDPPKMKFTERSSLNSFVMPTVNHNQHDDNPF